MSKADVKIVRIDNGDGSTKEVSWSEAELRIGQHYIDVQPVMKQLALGHPIRTAWATYQHARFYEEKRS